MPSKHLPWVRFPVGARNILSISSTHSFYFIYFYSYNILPNMTHIPHLSSPSSSKHTSSYLFINLYHPTKKTNKIDSTVQIINIKLNNVMLDIRHSVCNDDNVGTTMKHWSRTIVLLKIIL